ncbi:LSU ribosomal protein L4/L1 family protein [Giardia duodenalis]|uniref:Large ribosomal subunit protein uL4 n=1 Tax=Giardia intestinalis TaxID=5741 RepID=V6TH18_GIAIN|nr:LSU ribosomal protein L4/L1 family protein [Giardia intestinalis]
MNPTVKVFGPTGTQVAELPRPKVFNVPLRPDIINFVHTQLRKCLRTPYAVSRYAGVQCTAHSWGPGRAVARLPRKHGGVGAYANFARGGHMAHPTTVIRRWCRKVNLNQRRYAVASALAASANAALVEARGHRIADVPSIPLVVDTDNVTKTKDALAIIKAVGVLRDVERCKDSRHIRAGRGKMRNRRYVTRKGPLVIYNTEDVARGFRNLPGVDLCHVSSIRLLELAPGSHPGRLILWTKSAFASLDDVYAAKQNYTLPRSCITQTDIERILQSDAVQKTFVPKRDPLVIERKVDPFSSKEALARLDPSGTVMPK